MPQIGTSPHCPWVSPSARRLARHEDVATQREFEAAGVAVAVDAGDRRGRQRLEGVDGLGLEVAARCGIVVGDRLQVVAGAERSPCAAEHDAAHAVVIGERVEMGAQFDEHRWRERIELVRAIEGERGDAVAVVSQHEWFGHLSISVTFSPVGRPASSLVDTGPVAPVELRPGHRHMGRYVDGSRRFVVAAGDSRRRGTGPRTP